MSSSPRRRRGRSRASAGEDLRARSPGRSPSPRAAVRPSAAARSSSAVRTPSSRAERDHPLRPEPDQPAERDELRLDLALELLELGDPPGLDELARAARSMPGPDPAQLAHAPRTDELGDRRRASRGSARRRAGRRAPCSARLLPGRAARRTPRASRAISALSTRLVSSRDDGCHSVRRRRGQDAAARSRRAAARALARDARRRARGCRRGRRAARRDRRTPKAPRSPATPAPTLVDDPGGGQGAAVAGRARGLRAGPILIVNADVPCVVPDDLRALLAATPAGGIALVEALDGTTNALSLSARRRPSRRSTGADSAARFRAHAESLGLRARLGRRAEPRRRRGHARRPAAAAPAARAALAGLPRAS